MPAMVDQLAEARAALERVAEVCRTASARHGVDLPPVALDLRLDPASPEGVHTDRLATVQLAIASVDRLDPPPSGATLVYGVCHEMGHVVVSALVGDAPLPPVVWDEAVAHVLAVDVFLSDVERVIGRAVLPGDPLEGPGRVELERSSIAGPDAGAFGYAALLDRQSASLRALTADVGLEAVLGAVHAVASTAPSTVDWWRKVSAHARR